MAAFVKARTPLMRIVRVLFRLFIAVFLLMNIVVAFHAYKFTHVYDDPGGHLPNPHQMSSWQKAKAMVFGINAHKSVNKGQPAFPFDTVTLHTEDGLNLSAWYIPQDSAKGTVLLFHGHGSTKSAILPEAEYMHSLGYNVFLTDFRAHGNSGGNTFTVGYREAADVKAAYDYIRGKGEKNIVLWGVSLGAATIARAVAVYDIKPEKVMMELSFGSAYNAVKARVRIMHLPEQPLAGMLTFWGSVIRGFWVFDHSPAVYAQKIQCPVMIAHAAKDGRVTRAESDAIYNSIPHQHKRLVVYENAAHESLYKKEPEKWKAAVRSFLESGIAE